MASTRSVCTHMLIRKGFSHSPLQFAFYEQLQPHDLNNLIDYMLYLVFSASNVLYKLQEGHSLFYRDEQTWEKPLAINSQSDAWESYFSSWCDSIQWSVKNVRNSLQSFKATYPLRLYCPQERKWISKHTALLKYTCFVFQVALPLLFFIPATSVWESTDKDEMAVQMQQVWGATHIGLEQSDHHIALLSNYKRSRVLKRCEAKFCQNRM